MRTEAYLLFRAFLFLILGCATATADTVSDTLFVTGPDFSTTISVVEPKESVTVDISIPPIKIGGSESPTSDTLTISTFSVKLTSDAAGDTPDPGEVVGPILIPFSVTSDPSKPDDKLTVLGVSKSGETVHVFALPRTATVAGDTLTFSKIKFTLTSDPGKPDPTDGKPETFSGTISISANSDVPEPGARVLVGFGLLGLAGVVSRRRPSTSGSRAS
jgi:hypothetical protein